MGRSLRVSEEGLKKAKEAFDIRGWTQDYLAGSVKCTRQTVYKFFARGDVEKRIFEAICHELQLRVAEITDLESEEEQLNTSVSVNGNRKKSLGTLTQEQTETDEEKFSFSILGTASKVDLPKLKAIAAHLQRITGDTSIEIVDIEKGSIRLILEGSQESLEQIETLFKSGHLTEVEGIPVENVQFVTPKKTEYDKDIQTIDKKRLAFTIAGSVSSEEIQELKAAFTETSDKNKEKETDDKARLVQQNISQRAKRRNWRNIFLRNIFLRNTFLRDAFLRDAFLRDAFLRDAFLRDADLSGVNLSHANLRDANLSRANLSRASLSLTDLSRTNLSRANLSLTDLSLADLSRANLISADLSRANLIGANLRDADLSHANLISADLSRANLIGANLRDADLSHANLISADLSRANLISADVKNAQFGDNLGLTEEIQLDLKRRGAIFEDSPGDRSEVLSRS